MHGILTDTNAFARAFAQDFEAAAFLSRFRDADLLDQIMNQSRSKQTMQIIRQALGEQFRQFTAVDDRTREDGVRLLRVEATGVASELPIVWIYYHLSNDQGQRASLVFTVESDLLERFAAADAVLVESMGFRPADDRSASRTSETPDEGGSR